jgi:hypothetical protein
MRASTTVIIHRAISLVAITIACVGLCQASQAAAKPLSFYAYSTNHQLTVMRDGDVFARAPISMDRSQDGVAWTVNNRFAADITDSSARTADEPDLRQLVAIDTETGVVRRYPCPDCTSLAPTGGNTLMAAQSVNLDPTGSVESDNLSNMLRFDLTDPAPGTRFGSRLPQSDSGYLLGGYDGGAVLLGLAGSTSGLTEQYFTVTPGGNVQLIAEHDPLAQAPSSDHYLRAVVGAAAVQTPDGPVVAIAGLLKQPSPNCGEASDVTIYSASSHEYLSTDTSVFTPPARMAGVDAVAVVEGLWWSTDGDLHANVMTSNCTGEGATTTPPMTTEWRLRQGHWQRLSTTPNLYDGTLPDGSELTLDARYDLTWRTTTQRKAIAAGVASLALTGPLTTADAYDGAPDSSCLLGDQFDLGTRTGDIDGDGKPDRVDLVLCRAHPAKSSQYRLVAHVTFGKGRHLDQTLADDAQDTAGWLGISDLTGSHHDDLLLAKGADSGNVQHVFVFTYASHKLLPLSGDLTSDALVTSESPDLVDGFQCTVSNGRAQVTTFDLNDYYPSTSYTGQSTTYQATPTGTFTKVGSATLAYPAPASTPDTVRAMPATVVGKAGAHCPGLAAFPGGDQ